MPGHVRATVLLLACGVASGCRATDGGELPATSEEDLSGLAIHGSASLRYEHRRTGDARDQDLRAFVDLDFGDASKDRFTGRLSGRAALDVDGDSGDIFDGITDTFDSSLNGQLYDAYVDVHDPLGAIALVRLGRQLDYETPEAVVYDGVRVETRELGDARWRLGAYGGVSTHYYESSPAGDRVYGAYLHVHPWPDGRLNFDWIHADDERDLGGFDDDLLGVELWQELSRAARFEAAYTRLSDESRDLRLRTSWLDADQALRVQLSYYELFETQIANPLEFDKFSETLFAYFPFYRFDLSISKGIGERVQILAGIDTRRVDDDDDISDFNRDVDRYYLTTVFDQLGSENTSLSLTGDVWEGGDRDVQTWGADLTHRFRDDLEGSIGSYYSLYKFDLFNVEERDNVRTYYVRVERDLGSGLELQVDFEIEDNDVDDFQLLRVRLLWRF